MLTSVDVSAKRSIKLVAGTLCWVVNVDKLYASFQGLNQS